MRKLDLSGSRSLEKLIDFGEFPNLEWLNLEGCENLVALDPSIGLLRKLVYLNLDGCYNLISISNNIFSLSSLEHLHMRGSSKVFNEPIHLKKNKKKRHYITESASHSPSTSSVFKWTMLPHHSLFSATTTHTSLLPSLRSLHCLREVDISFCNLSKVPDAIECLHWLERLNLGGNNFVTLPSLRKLSKLEYLNLEHCILFEYLPQLPSPTTIGRERDEINKITGLFIFNCPKLIARERCSSMTYSWMLQFIKANPRSYFNRTEIVTPGSEIPSWINNWRVGDSIQFDRSPIMHDDNNNVVGIVCCAVFSMEFHRGRFPSWFNIKLFFNYIIYPFPLIIHEDLITAKSSHLWITYLPHNSFHEFGKICFKIDVRDGLGMEVKSCGYRWVFKQDLQEFNLTMMNDKNSLTRKGKILAIEDDIQPQPQPEQVITTSQRRNNKWITRKSTSDNAKTISIVNHKKRY